MKLFLTLSLLLFSFFQLQAQSGRYELKVISAKHAPVVGQLKKLSPEGLGIEDYKQQYFVFRPNEIKRIKVRKRGFSFFDGVKNGTLIGLGVAAGMLSLSGNEDLEDSQVRAAAIAVGIGAAGGTLAGAIARIVNTKLSLRINQDDQKFKAQFQKLAPYVDLSIIEHVN